MAVRYPSFDDLKRLKIRESRNIHSLKNKLINGPGAGAIPGALINTPTPSISITPTITPSISDTPTPTPTESVTPTITPSISFTPTATVTPSNTVTSTPTESVTPTITPSISDTPTPTPTESVTPTITPSVSITASTTPSISITPTITRSPTVTPSITLSPTVTPSISISPTPSLTPNLIPSPTPTPYTFFLSGPGFNAIQGVTYNSLLLSRFYFSGTGSTPTFPYDMQIYYNGVLVSIVSFAAEPGNNRNNQPFSWTPDYTDPNAPRFYSTFRSGDVFFNDSFVLSPTPTTSIAETPTPTPTVTPSSTPIETPTPTVSPTPSITPSTSRTGPLLPSGLGRYYENYNSSGKDVYVSVGYPISAIFDKTPGFDYDTSMSFISAFDRWGQVLDGSVFNSRTETSQIYNGSIFVSNPLNGVINNSIAIYLSAFYASSGDLGNTLGYAGIAYKRTSSEVGTSQYNIPYESYMAFNSYYTADDVATPTAGGKNSFYYTALHEIAHALGVGSNWYSLNTLNNPYTLRQCFRVGAGDNVTNPLGLGLSANFFYTINTLGNSRPNTAIGGTTTIGTQTSYIGDASFQAAYNANSTVGSTSKALTAYNNAFNIGLSAIPVENGVGFGSIGSHWEEGWGSGTYGTDDRSYYGNTAPGAPGLSDELMTPQSEGQYDMPLSRITIGSLSDLGYSANSNLADTYNPRVFNVYTNTMGTPLYIGFNGNTYSVQGFSFTTNSGKWGVLRRGLTYTFNIFTGASHPIYIVTTEGNTGSPPASRVTNGVSGDGTGSGTITWNVPSNLSTGYYYLQCGNHSIMSALLIVY